MPKPYKLLKSSSKHDNPRLSFWFFKRCIDLKTEVDITYANEDSLKLIGQSMTTFVYLIRGKYVTTNRGAVASSQINKRWTQLCHFGAGRHREIRSCQGGECPAKGNGKECRLSRWRLALGLHPGSSTMDVPFIIGQDSVMVGTVWKHPVATAIPNRQLGGNQTEDSQYRHPVYWRNKHAEPEGFWAGSIMFWNSYVISSKVYMYWLTVTVILMFQLMLQSVILQFCLSYIYTEMLKSFWTCQSFGLISKILSVRKIKYVAETLIFCQSEWNFVSQILRSDTFRHHCIYIY